jgi:hypothetical protein
MKEEKISIHRIIPMIGMVLSSILTTIILCCSNRLSGGQITCVLFLVVAFFPIILFELTFERRRKMIANNRQTTYKRAMVGFIICCMAVLVISFLPEFFKPVMFLPVIMSAFSNDTLGLIVGFFFNVILSVTTGGNFNELLAYTMLVLIGGMLSKVLKQVEYRLFIALIYLFSSMLFPNIFYYLENGKVEFYNVLLGLVNGVAVALYVIGLYPNIREKTYREKRFYYASILMDDFAQIKELRKLSQAEYIHARKVSEIAYRYALQLDLDAELAAAAGFYYHLGMWEGAPVIENAVKKANELCFPEEMIQILQEYYGADELPSTQESALIHMVDSVLIRVERYEAELGEGQCNKEVLVHQTLNESSSKGLYDKSGVSINSFIKIREWLAKEEVL